MFALINLVRLGMAVIISICLVLFVLVLGSIITSVAARADDYHVIELQELSLGYKDYAALNPNATDPVIYPEHPKEELSVNVKTDVFKYGYLDATTHGTTTSSQYRAVGLEVHLGLRVTDHFEVGYYHHSQHLLDRSQDYLSHFPVVDGIELRLFLFKNKDAREGLF